jgi:predicted lipoprotein with Yx(FWY)xxD motif
MSKKTITIVFPATILVLAVVVFFAARSMSVKNNITGTPISEGNYGSTSTTSTALTATPGTSLFMVESTSGQSYLADGNGMTLYAFNRDSAGTSSCYGQCAIIWPPYLINSTSSAQNLPSAAGYITRTDGTIQLTWNGKPLYYYSKDQNPGEMLGNGFDGLWHIVPVSGL